MLSGTMQQVRGSLQQSPTVLLGVGRWRQRDLESLAQHGNDPCQIGRTRTQLIFQCLGVERIQVAREYLNEGLVWRSEGALLVAMANEWPTSRRQYEFGELVGQRGLADARLADE
jgi:hypothetical protein